MPFFQFQVSLSFDTLCRCCSFWNSIQGKTKPLFIFFCNHHPTPPGNFFGNKKIPALVRIRRFFFSRVSLNRPLQNETSCWRRRAFCPNDSLKSLLCRGAHSTMDSVLASYPASRVWFLAFPKFFLRNFYEKKLSDVAKVNRQRCWLEQWTAEAWLRWLNPSSTG